MSLKYWIWLSAMTELKPGTRAKIIEVFGGAEAAYFADARTLEETLRLTPGEMKLVSDKSLGRATEILGRCEEEDVTILTLGDAAYPARLRNIFAPPIVLYIKGRLPVMDEQAAIGVVGTRRATPYGIKMARSFGYDLTKGGGLVVTGLAAGIDSAAAEGALRAGGSCVGVLGCSIDEIYPKNNDVLYTDVMAVGALVSEYPPGTPLHGRLFPERNRIVSGLSVGVLIIEAPLRSGALITADLALEQGREVFAVPGNADAPNCEGSNDLIRQGATLVSKGWDILEDFSGRFPDKIAAPDKIILQESSLPDSPAIYPTVVSLPLKTKENAPAPGRGFLKLRVAGDRKSVDKPKKREYIDLRGQLDSLPETQLKIVSVMNVKAKHVDDIIEESALSPATVLAELTMLELKGFVTREAGRRFSLNIRGGEN
ncbi:MAG: DNA-processing protein DprA [Oscillospiraceae bacterium]|jgi:DNA processing protein|nr:DNA-processing protein DprA [Oscillospiraceae bacterium]